MARNHPMPQAEHGESERVAERALVRQRPAAAPGSRRAGRGDSAGGLQVLQSTIGNQAVLRLLAAAQPKLVVGPANDPYEREADQVAQRVLAAIQSGKAGQTAAPQDEFDPMGGAPIARSIRRRAVVGAAGGDLDAATEGDLRREMGGGRPLDGGTRSSMESAFGSDFGHVRVHNDARSADLNQRVQARAFTIGSDIFLGSDANASNKELLAHELTHVVQQGGGSN